MKHGRAGLVERELPSRVNEPSTRIDLSQTHHSNLLAGGGGGGGVGLGQVNEPTSHRLCSSVASHKGKNWSPFGGFFFFSKLP